jgi:hypothetical protein
MRSVGVVTRGSLDVLCRRLLEGSYGEGPSRKSPGSGPFWVSHRWGPWGFSGASTGGGPLEGRPCRWSLVAGPLDGVPWRDPLEEVPFRVPGGALHSVIPC